MILSTKTKIMIVPDFGESAGSEAMVALKGTIEADRNYVVKVVDLPVLVQYERGDEELKDSEVIELSARKLEQLSHCPGLVWNGSNDTSIPKTKVISKFSD